MMRGLLGGAPAGCGLLLISVFRQVLASTSWGGNS